MESAVMDRPRTSKRAGPAAGDTAALQTEIDRVFGLFARRVISRTRYVEMMDGLYGEIPASARTGLDRRRDKRSLGEFSLHIYDTTVREHFLVAEWASLMAGLGLRLEDNGVENSGRLLLGAGRFGEADFLLHFPGRSYKLEVKFGPTQRFVTYKVEDLVNYLRREDVAMLTILGDASMVGPNGDPAKETPLSLPRGLCWFLANQARIRAIVARGEIGHHKGFGGKETVRLHAEQFEGVFGGLQAWAEREPIDLLGASR